MELEALKRCVESVLNRLLKFLAFFEAKTAKPRRRTKITPLPAFFSFSPVNENRMQETVNENAASIRISCARGQTYDLEVISCTRGQTYDLEIISRV